MEDTILGALRRKAVVRSNLGQWCAALALALISPSTLATVLNFTTVDQGMWESGNAAQLNESIFAGVEWETPPAEIGGFIGGEVTTPAVDPIQITPAIPRKLITPAIPRKLLIKSKKICVPFVGCTTTPAVYSPAIPAVYSPAIPAVYTPAIPAITLDTTTGAEVDVTTEGKVGLQFTVEATAGDVDANVDFNADIIGPEEVAAFQSFTLQGDSALLETTSFQTDFPSLSAKAEFVLGIKADINAEACAGGACIDDSVTIGFFDDTQPGNPLDPAVLELISLNDNDNGKIRLLGLDELNLPINFGDPISVETAGVEVGNVTVFIPNLETDSSESGSNLESAGETDILDLKLDLDGVATVASGGTIPPLEASLEAGIIDVGYNLLDIEFGPIIEIIQDFSIEPELMVDFEFSEPVWVQGLNEQVTAITTAFDNLPTLTLEANQDVEVTPTYWVDTILKNTTRLGIDGEFVLKALEATFSIGGPAGTSFDLGELGPVFELIERFDVADLPALFEEEFELLGFQEILGDIMNFSTILDDPAAPEAVLANAVATLITGSPVELSQEVSRPAEESFEFTFDYLFATATGVLDVFLNGTLIAKLTSPGVMSDFATYATTLLTKDFFGINELTGLLRFELNQTPGSDEQAVVLLDNVVFPGLLDGDFDQASLTGLLPTSWKGETSTEFGFVGATTFSAEVPSPTPALLMLIGLAALFISNRAQGRVNRRVALPVQ